MKLPAGLDILEDEEGSGPPAQAGDTVAFTIRIFLNRGDEVPMGEPEQATTLGKRRMIAGVEKALIGMRAGGYRKIRVGPHLAYGARGVPDVIPANAVLTIALRLRAITLAALKKSRRS